MKRQRPFLCWIGLHRDFNVNPYWQDPLWVCTRCGSERES